MNENRDFYRIESVVFWVIWLVVGVAGATGRIETTAWAWAFWLLLFMAGFFTMVMGFGRQK